MKEYKEIKTTRTLLNQKTCDLCGLITRSEDWSSENYAVAQTEIRCRIGSDYPDGGMGTEITIDLCPKCFKDKLVTYLKTEGVTVIEKEWDW